MVRLRLPVDGWDATAAVGALLMAYGAWLVYKPAGPILLGFLILVFGVFGAAHPRKERSE